MKPTTIVPAKEAVDHPSHYTGGATKCLGCGRPIECIDVVEHMNFNRGGAMKYVWRAGKKGGPDKEIEDLKKAVWLLNREITRLERKP